MWFWAMGLDNFAVWGYGLTALIFGGFALYLYAAWRGAAIGGVLLATVILSCIWALGCLWYASRPSEMKYLLSSVLDTARGGGWFAFLLLLLHPLLGRAWKRFLAIIILLIGAQLAGAVSFALQTSFLPLEWALKLIYGSTLAGAILGLVMIEQLYRGIPMDVRKTFKPLCMGLGAAYMFELYFFADSFLFGRPTAIIWAVRGPVQILILPLVAISGARNPSWSLRMSLSREAAFHSTALGLSGLYLLAVSGIGFYVNSIGGEWGQALQTVLLFAALLLLSALMVSSAQRARLRVLINKHLFPYRYDYRAEWLRFTRSLSSAASLSQLGQSVIAALGNLVESPSGILWLRDSAGESTDYVIQTKVGLYAQPNMAEPEDSPLMNFMRQKQWIINLEEYRRSPENYPGLVLPNWLASHFPNAWLLIPLIGSAGLIGFVLLATPRTRFDIDWEVLDLLKTAQHQAANDLERMLAAEDLLEARKFESFNRMAAFVVHDLKNLVAQLSLLLRNAERHKDNPEFQADMLETVAHAETKMRGLMKQLQEKRSIDPPRVLNLAKKLENICRTRHEQFPELELDIPPDCEAITVQAHPERLERVIGHVVQNAIEATSENGKVHLSLELFGSERVRIIVTDTGCGMSEEFIREHLSRPFQTTKSSGMGIGVYETSQYINELGGKVSYESKKGAGTRVTLELPLHTKLDSEHE